MNYLHLKNFTNYLKQNIYKLVKTKNKLVIRYDKKKPDINLKCRVYNVNSDENKDIDCVLIDRINYYEIHFRFKINVNIKQNYILFVKKNNDGTPKFYELIAQYDFECEEEWGEEPFNFPIELRESEKGKFSKRYAEFKCEKSSHKNNIFTAGNNEKMEFIFSKDSDIIITDIKLYNVINEHKDEEIEQALKYIVKDKNLDINIIFNKKGKYKLDIYY